LLPRAASNLSREPLQAKLLTSNIGVTDAS
jgi:hypothetical protein